MESRSLNCVLEAPESYVPRARYALEMLLLPLQITPRWVDRRRLENGDPGIYYGTGDGPASPRTLSIVLDPSTIAFFEGRTKYPAGGVTFTEIAGSSAPVLFPMHGHGFDPIASSFFWLSGWQEYTIRRRDQHGRFPYEASLQARWNTADRPAVDLYRRWLKDHLRSLEVMVERRTWGGAPSAFCPTHDIDYLRKWRPGIVYRELVDYFLRNRLGRSLSERRKRLRKVYSTARGGTDPYRYSWERMQEEEYRRHIGATYFLKTGAHGPYDVDGRSSRGYQKERIEDLLAGGFEIGLHPSYHAATHPDYMARELEYLRGQVPGRVRSVRQHYLRYIHPLTARMQAGLGLRIDSSMGFAAREGFRHGTCMPFRYFDIPANGSADLWMFPLAVMDSTLFGYRDLAAEPAYRRTLELIDTCKEFGGVCVALWHNIIYDPVDGHGYDRHFEAVLDEVGRRDTFVGSLGDAFEQWIGR